MNSKNPPGTKMAAKTTSVEFERKKFMAALSAN